MIEMEHIQQKNDGINWKCGAVSLEMILKYYGITCEQDEIWDAVKSVRPTRKNQYYALTYQLAQYAIQKGLCATIYKADYDSCLHILDYYDEINRPIIMSVTQKKSGDSHFTIYTGKKYGYYTFNDPDSKKNVEKYDYSEIRTMWQENFSVNVTGYIYIHFGNHDEAIAHTCNYCKREYPVLTRNGDWISDVTICPHCDSGNIKA